MKQPRLSEINQVRCDGFRPQIAGCFVDNRKVLFLYKREHDLWQFPQGGIENGEDLKTAFFREMAEELGKKFVEHCSKSIELIGEDKIIFPSGTQNSRELKNDAGQNIFMKGKKYFFIYSKAEADSFNIADSEFNDFKWADFEEGMSLCDKIYQAGKKRITEKALRQLRELRLI